MSPRAAASGSASLRRWLVNAKPSSRLIAADGGPRVSLAERAMESALRPIVSLLIRRDYRGGEHIPPSGGAIVAGNHISDVDPFVLGDFLLRNGRHTHFMAKSEVFDVPLLGGFLRKALQIAVRRHSVAAGWSLHEAAAAIHAGGVVALYPEGCESQDPEYWPQAGQLGVAALALATGAPVIPLVQWGTQQIRGLEHTLRLVPRARVSVWAGPPVDLSRWQGQPLDRKVLRDATNAVMAAIVDLESQVRRESPPHTADRAAREAVTPD